MIQPNGSVHMSTQIDITSILVGGRYRLTCRCIVFDMMTMMMMMMMMMIMMMMMMMMMMM